MTILQSFISFLQDNPFEKKLEKIIKILRREQLYGSLAMHAVIFCLVIYFISIKRWSRFEWTIIVCMTIKYTLFELVTVDDINSWIGEGSSLTIVFMTLYSSLGPICHWVYASQYIKTCFLIKGIVKRAILLFQSNKAVVDKFESSVKWDKFVCEQITIDEGMQREKSRAKTIQKIFLSTDIFMMAVILCS